MSKEVMKLDVEKRNQLLDMRDKLSNFMVGDGIPFSDDVKMVITRYLLLLFKLNPGECYLDSKDEQKDLEILKELQVKLDHEYAMAKDKYFVLQFAFVHAHRKRAMMLQHLSSLQNDSGIENDLRQWIKRQLLHDDWLESLEFANLVEKQLIEEAEENGADVRYLIQTAMSEPIEGKDLKSVEPQFKACQRELNDATRKNEENLYAYVHIPPMCESVERILSFLKATCLFKTDDDIKVDEESQHHSSMQPDDGAKLLERSQDAVQQPVKAEQIGLTSNRVMRAPEESQDYCSEMHLSRIAK